MYNINMENNSNKPRIDMKYLRGLINEDEEFARELFDIFNENVERNLEKMRLAIKDKNDNSWYMVCHAFKGSASSVGAFYLSKMLEYGQKNPSDSEENKIKLFEEVTKESKFVIEQLYSEIENK